MAKFNITGVSVRHISCLPGTTKYSNEEYKNKFGSSEVDKICNLTGVSSRRIFDYEPISDCFVKVSNDAIEKAGINKEMISCVLCVSQLGEHLIPGTSHIIHSKLQLNINTFCLDINLGCSGYIYGLTIMSKLLSGESGKYGLLLVGDMLSKKIDKKDRSNILLFGDAVTATIVKSTKSKNDQIYSILKSHGKNYKDLYIKNGGLKHSIPSMDSKNNYLYMNGMNIMKFVMTYVPSIIKETLEYSRNNGDNINIYFIHQANKYIVSYLIKSLMLHEHQVPINFEEFGNTSGASIPMAITKYMKDKNIQALTCRAILCGFGSGLSLGCLETNFNNITSNFIGL